MSDPIKALIKNGIEQNRCFRYPPESETTCIAELHESEWCLACDDRNRWQTLESAVKLNASADSLRLLEIGRYLPMLRCHHTRRSGGNDYLECSDCGLLWDYRRQTPYEMLANLLEKSLSDPPSVVVESHRR